MKSLHVSIGAAAVLVMGGCATYPTGPSALALPGTGKTFEQFRLDDGECQRYAFQQIGGGTAEKAAEESGVRSAVIGTAVGAVAGAAIGGRGGAGVGAGTGCSLVRSPGRTRAGILPTIASGGMTTLTSSACMPTATRFQCPRKWRA
jgi:hypothetical protein